MERCDILGGISEEPVVNASGIRKKPNSGPDSQGRPLGSTVSLPPAPPTLAAWWNTSPSARSDTVMTTIGMPSSSSE